MEGGGRGVEEGGGNVVGEEDGDLRNNGRGKYKVAKDGIILENFLEVCGERR